MEQLNPNPILNQENYWEGYQKSIEELKNNPEVLAFERMCYEVFEATEIGRKFLEYAQYRFIVNSQIGRGTESYQIDTVWQEGFRDAYRMILQSVTSHKQRIQAGVNQAGAK